eukprot:30714_1
MEDGGIASMHIEDQGKCYFPPAAPTCDPPELPINWHHKLDNKLGLPFYYNDLTGESRWIAPGFSVRSVCGIPLRRPYYGKLFGLGVFLFTLWCWCLLALSFDDWIAYTQNDKWSFTVGLYEPCVQGTRACRLYISAGILYIFSVGFLFLACLLLWAAAYHYSGYRTLSMYSQLSICAHLFCSFLTYIFLLVSCKKNKCNALSCANCTPSTCWIVSLCCNIIVMVVCMSLQNTPKYICTRNT